MPDADEPVPASCKTLLEEWRAAPTFDFGAGYELVRWLLEDIAAARSSGRLDEVTARRMEDGAVVRARRGDPVDSIMEWVTRYAARRGYAWRASR